MIGILAIDPRTGVISTQVRNPLFPAASLDYSYIESRLRKVVMERQKLRERMIGRSLEASLMQSAAAGWRSWGGGIRGRPSSPSLSCSRR